MKKKTKYLYLYLIISKKPLPILKGEKLLHVSLFNSKQKANMEMVDDKEFDSATSLVLPMTKSLYRYKILTFKIN